MPNSINSAVVIARLLDTEGFSDYTANQVEKYWKRSAKLSPRQLSKLKKLDSDITALSSKLTEGEKLAMGRFIGLHKKMSFEVGLRIGITTFVQKCNSPAEAGGK